mmetsp:Transcript_1766/g.6146  ORF Transcript_1766/g.6146 Transcript_1766/m.6146 type:complete len:229 (+) Transcript_1766:710-1396(+)
MMVILEVRLGGTHMDDFAKEPKVYESRLVKAYLSVLKGAGGDTVEDDHVHVESVRADRLKGTLQPVAVLSITIGAAGESSEPKDAKLERLRTLAEAAVPALDKALTAEGFAEGISVDQVVVPPSIHRADAVPYVPVEQGAKNYLDGSDIPKAVKLPEPDEQMTKFCEETLDRDMFFMKGYGYSILRGSGCETLKELLECDEDTLMGLACGEMKPGEIVAMKAAIAELL